MRGGRAFWLAAAVALPGIAYAQSTPDLRQPAGKEWLSIGGDWSNSR